MVRSKKTKQKKSRNTRKKNSIFQKAVNKVKNQYNWFFFAAEEFKFFVKRVNEKTKSISFYVDDDVLKFIKTYSKDLSMSENDVVKFMLYSEMSKETFPPKTKKKLKRKIKNK